MASSLVYIVAFLASLNAALALKCYSCDSSKGVSCNYGLLSLTYDTIECDDTGSKFMDTISSIIPKQCIKLVGIDKDNNEYVARGCSVSTGPINTCQAIAKTVQFADKKDLNSLDCYTCNEDKCNTATTLSGMTIVGLLAACFLFLF